MEQEWVITDEKALMQSKLDELNAALNNAQHENAMLHAQVESLIKDRDAEDILTVVMRKKVDRAEGAVARLERKHKEEIETLLKEAHENTVLVGGLCLVAGFMTCGTLVLGLVGRLTGWW